MVSVPIFALDLPRSSRFTQVIYKANRAAPARRAPATPARSPAALDDSVAGEEAVEAADSEERALEAEAAAEARAPDWELAAPPRVVQMLSVMERTPGRGD